MRSPTALLEIQRKGERVWQGEEPAVRLDDYDWEGAGFTLPRAIYDQEEQLFKLWYCITTDPYVKSNHLLLCYAESEDGLYWLSFSVAERRRLHSVGLATLRQEGDARALWNRPIWLKFYLTECWIYSFRFGFDT